MPLRRRITLLVHFSVGGHLGRFRLLAVVTNAAVNVAGKRQFEILPSVLAGVDPETERLTYGRSLNFSKSHHPVFLSSRTILHPPTCAQGFQFLHPRQHGCFLKEG